MSKLFKNETLNKNTDTLFIMTIVFMLSHDSIRNMICTSYTLNSVDDGKDVIIYIWYCYNN